MKNYVIALSLLLQIATCYVCDPSVCIPPDCRCASTSPPSRLDGTPIPLNQVPQFVTVTWDDSVNDNQCWQYLVPAVLTSTARDSLGCTPKNTFYVSSLYTNYSLVEQLYAAGHEIAVHTFTHTTSIDTSSSVWTDEIRSSRLTTSTLAQVPLSDMVGFRAPFLQYNPQMFNVLDSQGFLFDSSIEDIYGAGLSTVQDGLTWPYTFDYGTPQNPDTGVLPSSVPGLWEVPMACLHNADNSVLASMDPPQTGSQLLDTLKRNFNQHLNTNRSPFGLYSHSSLWLAPDPVRVQVVADFYTWVATQPGVVFATAGQIVRYMQSPVPISELSSLSAFYCPQPPSTTSAEVCDGIDNDLDGVVDDGVLINCAYESANVWFASCTACPSQPPTLGTSYTGYNPVCGNGVCSVGESCRNCPSDCGCSSSSSGSTSTTTGARPMTTTSSPRTTGRIPSLTTSVQRPVTTGQNLPSTTSRIRPVTTGSVGIATTATTTAAAASTSSPPSSSGSGPITGSCSTAGSMRCAGSSSYQVCDHSLWQSVQQCQSGLVCQANGMYIYCVRP